MKHIKDYSMITSGSILYALATVLFIFPHSLLLGGTSGISVILTAYLPFSPGVILLVINYSLLVLAFFILGKEMAVKSLVGSVLTTAFVGIFEGIITTKAPLISNIFLSAITGALIIAVASGIMFYVKSSSGGTDIIRTDCKKILVNEHWKGTFSHRLSHCAYWRYFIRINLAFQLVYRTFG